MATATRKSAKGKPKVAKNKAAKKRAAKKGHLKQTAFVDDLTIKEIDDAAQSVFDCETQIKRHKFELDIRKHELHKARKKHNGELKGCRYFTEVSDDDGGIHRKEVVLVEAKEEETVLKKAPKKKGGE